MARTVLFTSRAVSVYPAEVAPWIGRQPAAGRRTRSDRPHAGNCCSRSRPAARSACHRPRGRLRASDRHRALSARSSATTRMPLPREARRPRGVAAGSGRSECAWSHSWRHRHPWARIAPTGLPRPRQAGSRGEPAAVREPCEPAQGAIGSAGQALERRRPATRHATPGPWNSMRNPRRHRISALGAHHVSPRPPEGIGASVRRPTSDAPKRPT